MANYIYFISDLLIQYVTEDDLKTLFTEDSIWICFIITQQFTNSAILNKMLYDLIS